jgi:hypothetical protein
MINYLADVKYNTSFIPAYASVDESTLLAVEENEKNYNTMMQGFALEELGLLEANEWDEDDVDSEKAEEKKKGKIGQIIDAVVKFFKDVWANILGVINKFFNFIKEKVRSFNDKVRKSTLERVSKNLDKIKDKDYGKINSYTGLAEVLSGGKDLKEPVSTFWNSIVHDAILADANKEKVDAEKIKKATEVLEKSKKDMLKTLAGKDVEKMGEVKSELVKYLKGEQVSVNKEFINKEWDNILKCSTDYNANVDQAKKMFEFYHKLFNQQITDWNKAKKTSKGEQLAMYKAAIPYAKFGANTCTVVTGAVMSGVKARMNSYMAIATKIYLGIGKKLDTEGSAKHESAVFQTQLNSLFDF